MNPLMEEILKSEYHRCVVNLEANKLQLQVAKSQLERLEERVKLARERLIVVEGFCVTHEVMLLSDVGSAS